MHRGYILQIISTICGSMATFTTGQIMGWTSPSVPFLESPESVIPGGISASQASWVASLSMVGNLIAVLIVATFADYFGRKTVLTFSAIPTFCAWILIYYVNTIELLYIARIIIGVGEVMGKATLFMYVAEIADSKIRGALGTIIVVALNSGILFEYGIGPLVSFKHLALISSVIPVILFITFPFMPESPYYLLARGETIKAQATLRQLRGTNDVDAQIDEINKTLLAKISQREALRLLFRVKKYRKLLLVMCAMFASQEFSGITPTIMYAETIFEKSDIGGILPSALIPVILPIVKITGTFITTVLVDRLGRRPLFLFSTSFCGLSMLATSAYFYLESHNVSELSSLTWIPVVSLTSFNFCFIVGLGSLPFIMIGELFPSNVKAVAICLTSMTATCSGIIVTKLFQILKDEFGLYMPFAFFTTGCFISFIFSLYKVPETKKQTLEQLQRTFHEGI